MQVGATKPQAWGFQDLGGAGYPNLLAKKTAGNTGRGVSHASLTSEPVGIAGPQDLDKLAGRVADLGFNCVRLCYSTAPRDKNAGERSERRTRDERERERERERNMGGSSFSNQLQKGFPNGYGSKLNRQTAGFSPCFHLRGNTFWGGPSCLTHRQMGQVPTGCSRRAKSSPHCESEKTMGFPGL